MTDTPDINRAIIEQFRANGGQVTGIDGQVTGMAGVHYYF